MPMNMADYKAKVTDLVKRHARVTGCTAIQGDIIQSSLDFRSAVKVFCQTIYS